MALRCVVVATASESLAGPALDLGPKIYPFAGRGQFSAVYRAQAALMRSIDRNGRLRLQRLDGKLVHYMNDRCGPPRPLIVELEAGEDSYSAIERQRKP